MLKYLLVLALASPLHAETITLEPVADTTLFELEPTHNLGGHINVAVGGIAKEKATGGAYAARGLFKFAITNIPPEATISSVTLTLNLSRSPGNGGVSSVFDLRRALKSWGEGDKRGNTGAEASPLEATWSWRFAPTEAWETPGGAVGADFASTVSASVVMGDPGAYTIASTSNLIADVRAWLTNPETNFGWVLISQSENKTETARRFDSREVANTAPSLVLEYSGPTQELRITSITILNQNAAIAWTGGSPPYQLQQKLSLIDTNWTSAGAATTASDATVPVTAHQSFFRVAQVAATPVVVRSARSKAPVLGQHNRAVALPSVVAQPRR